jgi:hypothetical protein
MILLSGWQMYARQADGELANPTVDHHRAAMLLGDDVPARRRPHR